MALIGVLNIGLKANTSVFRKDMKRAQGITQSFGKSLGTLKALALGAGAALAAAFSANKIREAMGELDSLKKFSDLIGLSAEKLQVFEIQAARSGQTVNSLRTSLQRMTRRIGEAAVGTGPAALAIERLGLKADELFKMSPDEQFLTIGAAMSEVANMSERAALGVAIFDTEGLKSVETAEAMATGFDAVRSEAELMNQVMSDIELTQIETANDRIDDMFRAVGNVVNIIAADLAPFITLVAEKIIQWQKTFSVIDSVKSKMSIIGDIINGLVVGANVLKGIFKGVTAAIEFIVGGLARLFARLADFTGKSLGIESLEDFAQQAEAFGQSLVDSGWQSGTEAGEAFGKALDAATTCRPGEIILEKLKKGAKEIIATSRAEAEKTVKARAERNAAGRTDDALASLKKRAEDAKNAIAGAKEGNKPESRRGPTLAASFDRSLVNVAAIASLSAPELKEAKEANMHLKKIQDNTKNPNAVFAP